MKNTKTKTKKAKAVAESKAVALPLNPEEQAIIDKWKQNKEGSQTPFRFRTEVTPEKTTFGLKALTERGTDNEKRQLAYAGMCEITGVESVSFAVSLFTLCADATGLLNDAKPDNKVMCLDMVADALHAMKPQDEIEMMLIGRLISLNFQSMDYLKSSSAPNMSTQMRDMHLNRSTKLFRVYNETLEALMRYRRKGEQKVVVQHVNVENGAQAVIGDIHQGGGGCNKY